MTVAVLLHTSWYKLKTLHLYSPLFAVVTHGIYKDRKHQLHRAYVTIQPTSHVIFLKFDWFDCKAFLLLFLIQAASHIQAALSCLTVILLTLSECVLCCGMGTLLWYHSYCAGGLDSTVHSRIRVSPSEAACD